MRTYILSEDGTTPIPCDDLIRWAEWMSVFERRKVALTKVVVPEVSTVFLGMDHSFDPMGKADPVLWETMVFDGHRRGLDLEMDRCAGTRADAEAMHQRMVEKWKTKSETQ